MAAQVDWREKILPLSEQPITDTERYDEYARIGEMLDGGMDIEDAAYLILGPDEALEAYIRMRS